MNSDTAAIAYLVSGVLFILALRGLSSPESSRQGNRFGMLGMANAIVTTLLLVHLDGATIGFIALPDAGIKTQSLIEMSLGTAIGAVTFTGSVIAFAKLNGNMSGAPIILPARHLINSAIFAGIVILIMMMMQDAGRTE